MEEDEDHSWDFLYEVADQVDEWPEDEIEKLMEAGKILSATGAAYMHDKEYEDRLKSMLKVA